jgi:hypothetical protein
MVSDFKHKEEQKLPLRLEAAFFVLRQLSVSPSSGERRPRRSSATGLLANSDECRFVGVHADSYRCTPVSVHFTGTERTFSR